MPDLEAEETDGTRPRCAARRARRDRHGRQRCDRVQRRCRLAFLPWVATQTLGPERVLCVTAVSPSLASGELADCRALATEWGLRLVEVETEELADPAYAANDGIALPLQGDR